MTAAQGRVRLRWTRGSYITVAMPWAEAGQLQDEVLDEVLTKGDGLAFVDFTGHDGREVSVRAREVVAVECLPELPDRVLPPPREAQSARPASGAAMAALSDHPGHPSVEHKSGASSAGGAGTDFLRQRASQVVTS